jgi:hypothetical protein
MKKFLLFIFLAGSWFMNTSCNKILGKTCWDCEVTRMNGTTYKEKVCRDDDRVPQFTDDLGNDLGSYCTKR